MMSKRFGFVSVCHTNGLFFLQPRRRARTRVPRIASFPIFKMSFQSFSRCIGRLRSCFIIVCHGRFPALSLGLRSVLCVQCPPLAACVLPAAPWRTTSGLERGRVAHGALPATPPMGPPREQRWAMERRAAATAGPLTPWHARGAVLWGKAAHGGAQCGARFTLNAGVLEAPCAPRASGFRGAQVIHGTNPPPPPPGMHLKGRGVGGGRRSG